ncbi:MAG: S8 family serine peptidase [Saprospiraceae bacterium]
MKKLIYLSLLLMIQNAYSQVRIESSVNINLLKKEYVPVLIYFKDQADLSAIEANWTKAQKGNYVYHQLKEKASTTQKNIIHYLISKNIKYQSFFIANSIKAEINTKQLSELSQFNEVKSILYDVPLQLEQVQLDLNAESAQTRTAEITWGLKNIQAIDVWNQGYEGQGVTVAGADTGYKWDVAGIKERYRGWNDSTVNHAYHWHDAIHNISPLANDSINPCGLNLKEPCDDNGHGTHTAGTMLGKTDDFFYGVAPRAKWIGCRNMERGNGAPSTYIECFEFFLAPTDSLNQNPKPELAPHVINNSWYCSVSEGCNLSNFEVMHIVIKNLKAAGIVVVVSAGNQGNSCSSIAHPPAMFEESFSIGSYAINDTISGFSAMGPVIIDSSYRIKPNVVAPGSGVISRTKEGNLEAWNGTSMAGPHVAGLVALIISANPSLAGKVDIIENIIESTSRYADSHIQCDTFSSTQRPNNMYGFGKINALEAVNKARVFVNVENENKLNPNFIIQPNPGQDYFEILSQNPLGQIWIYNSIGQLMVHDNTANHQKQIQSASWEKGIYFIKIQNKTILWSKI